MDITIIGSGTIGHHLASACSRIGLNVLLVDKDRGNVSDHSYECVNGLGVIAHTGMVHILNPETGDEVRIVECSAVAFALDSVPDASYSKMSGMTKYGARFNPEGQIEVNTDGETNARKVYATGPWASVETPGIVNAIARFCKPETTKEQV